MSLKIISKLIYFIKFNLNVNEEEIIIKNIEIKDDCKYTMELKIKDHMYSIRHFEPLNIIQGVEYGMGPYYDTFLFDKEKGSYVKIEFNCLL